MIGIYKITSPSKKVYIGQSWNIKERFRKYNYKSNQQLLMRSFSKYGLENHVFEIVEELNENITQEFLDDMEIYYMKLYKNNGFILLNIREGGSRGKASPETILKMKNSLKGRKSPNKGKKFSQETKDRISKAKKGWKPTSEMISKRLVTIANKPFTEKQLMQINNFRKLGVKSIIKSVLQYDKENFIKEYESIAEAQRITNIKSTGISNCLAGRAKTAGGFIWKYKMS